MVAARHVRWLRTMLRLALWTLLAAAIDGPLGAQDTFPHPAHEGLFPLCAGCHPGADSEGARLHPPASLCANCHDGSRLARVRWSPPAETRSSFRHAAHRQIARREGKTFECVECHGLPGGARMAVGALNVGAACSGCHAVHEADSNCLLCHSPERADHPLAVHAGCDRCHGEAHIDALPRTRSFCLLCHEDMKPHAAPRNCVDCHML